MMAVEQLEPRELLTGATWPGLLHPVTQALSNDTVDQAQFLGNLSVTGRAEVVGNIGNGPAGSAQVAWYSFTLDHAAHVTFQTVDAPATSSFVSVLSLYNHDSAGDPFDPLGYRQLAQDDGGTHGGDARLDRSLASGTYYLAVSGSGDRYFHPLIAGSGYAGSTGNYGLLVTGADLGLAPTDGPAVLTTDPAMGSQLDRSPFVIRMDLSKALSAGSIQLGRDVSMIGNPTGHFGDGNDFPVTLASYRLSTATSELELMLANPLAPGSYRLLLAGAGGAGSPVLQDGTGKPLGRNALHPAGQDFALTFGVVGFEGIIGFNPASDDTAATAHQLGDFSTYRSLQVAGAIGTDSTDPVPFNPADVDLYHFTVAGPGRFHFAAEVFAARIGSPLDSGLSLFRLDPTAGWILVDANDDTLNHTISHDGQRDLLATDSALSDGLIAGDYYVAVSSGGNVPNAIFGDSPGDGVFLPGQSQSGTNGSSIGPYVLNLLVEPDNVPPQVRAVHLLDGSVLTDGEVLTPAPTGFVFDFSKPTNLIQLGQVAWAVNGTPQLNAVFVLDASQNPVLSPYLHSVQAGGAQGSFLMYDALPDGSYELHLSAGAGLADLAGNLLVGNTGPGGDYVLHFSVHGSVRGSPNSPTTWISQEPNNNPSQPQVIGPLFPNELASGVTIARNSTVGSPADRADYYQVQLNEQKVYSFILTGDNLPAGMHVNVYDTAGHLLASATSVHAGGISFQANLSSDTYVVKVDGWSLLGADGQPTLVQYNLTISINQSAESPPPLSIGPGPALRFRQVPGVLPPLLGSTGSSSVGSSVLPVVSPTTPAQSGSGLSGGADLPAGILLAFGAGPTSGVGFELAITSLPRQDIYDRIFAPSGSSSLAARAAASTADSGTAQTETKATITNLLDGIIRQLKRIDWKRTVEQLYKLQDVATPQLQGAVDADSEEPQGNSTRGPEDEGAGQLDREEYRAFSDHETSTPAWAAGAALALLTPRTRPSGLKRTAQEVEEKNPAIPQP